MASETLTLSSKPGVVGSNPAGRARLPSETAGAGGRLRPLKVASGPHRVPANAVSGKTNARSGKTAPRGDLLAGRSPAELASILARLDAKTTPEPNTGCSLWMGAATDDGYGKIGLGRRADNTRRIVYTHRLAYELARGPIPDGLEIDHLCRVRCCLNPKHLEAVTTKVNAERRLSDPQANTEKARKGWATRRDQVAA